MRFPVAGDRREKRRSAKLEQCAGRRGPHRRRSGDVAEKGDLAEEVAGTEPGRELPVHLHLVGPVGNQIERLARVTLTDDDVAGGDNALAERVGQPLAIGSRQRREDRGPGEQRPPRRVGVLDPGVEQPQAAPQGSREQRQRQAGGDERTTHAEKIDENRGQQRSDADGHHQHRLQQAQGVREQIRPYCTLEERHGRHVDDRDADPDDRNEAERERRRCERREQQERRADQDEADPEIRP